jgi:hypothetical protein
MRYLHLSCHGDEDGLELTLGEISFKELGRIARPALRRRRLFVSACDAASPTLARAILPKSGCLSVAGPSGQPAIHDAAVGWAAFYHLMFKRSRTSMRNSDIVDVLRVIKSTFSGAHSNVRVRQERRRHCELTV